MYLHFHILQQRNIHSPQQVYQLDPLELCGGQLGPYGSHAVLNGDDAFQIALARLSAEKPMFLEAAGASGRPEYAAAVEWMEAAAM